MPWIATKANFTHTHLVYFTVALYILLIEKTPLHVIWGVQQAPTLAEPMPNLNRKQPIKSRLQRVQVKYSHNVQYVSHSALAIDPNEKKIL